MHPKRSTDRTVLSIKPCQRVNRVKIPAIRFDDAFEPGLGTRPITRDDGA
jgi:hypothetical protein